MDMSLCQQCIWFEKDGHGLPICTNGHWMNRNLDQGTCDKFKPRK